MAIFEDLKLIDRLRIDEKLNPIYLDEGLEDLISVTPTSSLTQILFNYSMNKSELSDEQVDALVSDIKTLKEYGLWDIEQEQQTLKQCKETIDDEEAYKMLSTSDKAKFDAEFYKQFEL